MYLRASFATGMLKYYRHGLKIEDITEDQFLCYIAKIINTSAAMSREAYIASNEKSFELCAMMEREMMGACADGLRVDDADLM